ncbi:hypothetical protein Tco_0204506, partial [Tanacetum coccineum]
MAQQPMRSEEELFPTNMRFVTNKSNVRIDPDETQDEPLFEFSLEILKHHTIYNAITLTTDAPEIYMQQFLYTASKNEKNNRYYFILDYQRFKIGANLFHHALQISPRQLNKQFFPPLVQHELVTFIKTLVYADSLTTISQVVEIKESDVYVNYLAKYPHAQSGTPTHGRGQGNGYMRKGDMEINIPKPKKQKDAVPRRSRTITFADNMLEDPEQALDYAKLVKLKAQKQASPEAQLLLNLKKQTKESKKQRILEEIRKAPKKNSTDDDKTESERDSDNGDDNDKSNNEDESVDSENDDSDKDSNDDDDQAANFVIRLHEKEPKQPQKEPQLHSPSFTTTSSEDISR